MCFDDFDHLNDFGIAYLQALQYLIKFRDKVAQSFNGCFHRPD